MSSQINVQIHENTLFFPSVSRMVADINSLSIFAMLPINAVFFAITMYNTEYVSRFLSFSPFSITIKRFLLKIIPFGNFQYSNDVLSFVFNVMCIVCSTIWPSFYSYYATVATEQILTIGDATYNSNWFNYPVKMQKHVILIVARSQKRVLFSGLNLMYCTVEYFGKVSNPLGYYWIKTIWLEWVWDVEFNLTFF